MVTCKFGQISLHHLTSLALVVSSSQCFSSHLPKHVDPNSALKTDTFDIQVCGMGIIEHIIYDRQCMFWQHGHEVVRRIFHLGGCSVCVIDVQEHPRLQLYRGLKSWLKLQHYHNWPRQLQIKSLSESHVVLSTIAWTSPSIAMLFRGSPECPTDDLRMWWV